MEALIKSCYNFQYTVVGVDHTFNRNVRGNKTTSKNTYGYNEGTTDHFIVVIGKGLTKDGKNIISFLIQEQPIKIMLQEMKIK